MLSLSSYRSQSFRQGLVLSHTCIWNQTLPPPTGSTGLVHPRTTMCDDECADYIRRAVIAAKAWLDALPTLEDALLEDCASGDSRIQAPRSNCCGIGARRCWPPHDQRGATFLTTLRDPRISNHFPPRSGSASESRCNRYRENNDLMNFFRITSIILVADLATTTSVSERLAEANQDKGVEL